MKALKLQLAEVLREKEELREWLGKTAGAGAEAAAGAGAAGAPAGAATGVGAAEPGRRQVHASPYTLNFVG